METTFSFRDFINWERTTHDTIDLKKIYIDIAEDLTAGVLLSQIVYWYLPNKQGKTKLRVKKDGHYWIAKKVEDWYEEIRLTRYNYETAIKKLIKKGIVVKKRFKFDGAPTTHIRLNIPMFLKYHQGELNKNLKQVEENDHDFYDYLEGEMETEKGGKEGKRTPEPLGGMDSVESHEWNSGNPPNGFDGLLRIYNRDYSKDHYREFRRRRRRTGFA